MGKADLDMQNWLNRGNDKGTWSINYTASGGQVMKELIDAKKIECRFIGDERGSLVIADGGIDIPFDPKRVFYIFGSDSTIVRGCHANKYSEFFLINVAGTSKIKIKNGKGDEAVFLMDRPHIGLHIPPMIWKEMYDFSPNSVLLCLASTHYDPDEYIKDYDEYVRIINAAE